MQENRLQTGTSFSILRDAFGRAVSSVVEHYLDTVGVRGSKPLPRTILFTGIAPLVGIRQNNSGWRPSFYAGQGRRSRRGVPVLDS